MSLVQETQKEQSQEPTKPLEFEFKAPGKIPEPSLPPEMLAVPQEQELPRQEVNAEDAPSPEQVVEAKAAADLMTYFGAPSPNQTAPSIPQAPNIPLAPVWQHSKKDLGFENLYNRELVINKSPTLYQQPLDLSSNVGSASATFTTTAGNLRQREQQAAAQQAAYAAAARNAIRTNTPNLPNSTKPWWENATGWLGEGVNQWFFGTPSARQNTSGENRSVNPLAGEWGVYGSGVFGAIKAGFSLPIGLTSALVGETQKNVGVPMAMTRLWVENPAIAVRDAKGNTTMRPFRSLSEFERRREAEARINQNLRTFTSLNFDFEYARRRNLFVDAFSLQRQYDDLNDANPNLKPVGNAKPEQPKGIFFAANRRPGQTAITDPASFTIEVVNQLFSPFNNSKIDVLGNATEAALKKTFGAGARLLRGGKKTAAEQAARNLDELSLPEFNVNLPKPATPQAGSRVVSNSPFGARLPKRSVQQQILSQLSSGVGVRAQQPITAQSLQRALVVEGGQVQVRQIPNRIPLSPSVTEIMETAKNLPANLYVPPKSPARIAGEVGIGTPGQVLEAPLSFQRRTLQETIKNLPADVVEGFNGKTWYELQQHVVAKGRAMDEVSSIAALPPAKTTTNTLEQTADELIRRGVRKADDVAEQVVEQVPEQADESGGALVRQAPTEDLPSTMGLRIASETPDDVAQQAIELPVPKPLPKPTPLLPPSSFSKEDLLQQFNDLTAQRLLVNSQLEALDELFASTVDMGRRTTEDLPIRPIETEELSEIIAEGFAPPLAKPAKDILNANPEAIEKAAVVNNAVVNSPTRTTPVNRSLKTKPKYTVKAPPTTVHGTALKDWNGAYDLYEYGSRGELGSGLYTTSSFDEAESYAKAFVGENASPPTREMEIQPGVYEINNRDLISSLDARAEIGEGTNFYKALNEAIAPLKVELKRGRKLDFASYMSKVEEVVAKAGGGEVLLQNVNRQISESLRKQGYDSVVDARSGWTLRLTNGELKPPRLIKNSDELTQTVVAKSPAKKGAKKKAAAVSPAPAPVEETPLLAKVEEIVSSGRTATKEPTGATWEVLEEVSAFNKLQKELAGLPAEELAPRFQELLNPYRGILSYGAFEETLYGAGMLPKLTQELGQEANGFLDNAALEMITKAKETVPDTYNQTVESFVRDNILRYNVPASFAKTNEVLQKDAKALLDPAGTKAASAASDISKVDLEVKPAKPSLYSDAAEESPEALAARARYNADAAAAAAYPDHLTSNANLNDSAAKVLNEVQTQLDETLEKTIDEIEVIEEARVPEIPEYIQELWSKYNKLEEQVFNYPGANIPRKLEERMEKAYMEAEEATKAWTEAGKPLDAPKPNTAPSTEALMKETDQTPIDPCNF